MKYLLLVLSLVVAGLCSQASMEEKFRRKEYQSPQNSPHRTRSLDDYLRSVKEKFRALSDNDFERTLKQFETCADKAVNDTTIDRGGKRNDHGCKIYYLLGFCSWKLRSTATFKRGNIRFDQTKPIYDRALHQGVSKCYPHGRPYSSSFVKFS